MTVLYTTLTLIAFAANSLLCRLALGGRTIDAASFTTVRFMSGATMLLAISAIARGRPLGTQPSALSAQPSALPSSLSPRPSALTVHLLQWRPAIILFLYAIAFSFAYLSLSTGTGALILFGAVQITMLTAAIVAGERPQALEWVGLASALIGLGVLAAPGLSGPPIGGSLLMAAAGICWGFYSLWGRGIADPLDATTRTFVRVTPLLLIVSLASMGRFHVTTRGVLLAASSGALASGVGYVLWYSALSDLTATRAAMVQLAVPVIAAAGGVVLLSEEISMRLVAAAALIVGGIGLAIVGKR